MHPAVRGVFGVLAALFAYAAVIQLNDPDPVMWVAIYTIAMGLCGLAALNNPAPATFNTAALIVALVWAIYLGNQVYGDGIVRPMYPEQRMTGNLLVDTEEGREMGGLLVIVAALGLLTVVQGYTRYRPVRHSDRRIR